LRFTASQSLSDSSNLKIGCIARLTHDKGIDLLVEAVKNISNVDLMIVGKGREEKNLENLIAGKENIKLISYVADLNEFYSSLDLLVLPSREHDPFGLVAAEAMMLGIPVIVTDACGIADDLTSGKDALIVEADSSAALSEAIKSMQDSENRLRIGTACKETAHQKFTLKRMIDRYEKLFA
jgi:glycosyltransferase involved in cell wall biosynthesis